MHLEPSRRALGGARMLLAGAGLMAGLFTSLGASAQTASIYGSLGNFDVSNDTGQNACGFEVDIAGVTQADIGGTFTVNRYGTPAMVPYAGGLKIQWKARSVSPAGSCTEQTIPHVPGTFFGGTCYSWNPTGYDTAGCEHFGVWMLSGSSGQILTRWLAPDPANPGSLAGVNPPVPVAMPNYVVLPPAAPGLPAQVQVEVVAPEPAEAPNLYGDAQWMRTFMVQVPREVTLNELVTDNAIVPQNLAQLEGSWSVIQDEPVAGGNGKRKRHRSQSPIDPTTRTIVRRIELYGYTGAYDPVTHEALCADGLCNAPAAGEQGDLISAQMTAVLVQPDVLIVSKSGNGSVDSADKRIACGSKCAAPYDAGSAVTLTAKAGSGSQFAGWTGVCSGSTTSTCNLLVSGRLDAGATFTLVPATGGGGGGGGGNNTDQTISIPIDLNIDGKSLETIIVNAVISNGRVISRSLATQA